MKLRELIAMLNKAGEHVGYEVDVAYTSSPNDNPLQETEPIRGLMLAIMEPDPDRPKAEMSAVDLAMGPPMPAKVLICSRAHGVS